MYSWSFLEAQADSGAALQADETALSALWNLLLELYHNGCCSFVCGMGPGIAVRCAEAVEELRQRASKVKLLCVLPFQGYEEGREEAEKRLFRKLLLHADRVTVVSQASDRAGCLLEQERQLIHRADALIVLCAAGRAEALQSPTVRHLREIGRFVILFDPAGPSASYVNRPREYKKERACPRRAFIAPRRAAIDTLGKECDNKAGGRRVRVKKTMGEGSVISESLKKASLEILLLALLRQRDMYAYEMSMEIARRSEGKYRIITPVVYPVLQRLEGKGFVSSRESVTAENRRTNIYHLEKPGTDYLEEQRSDFSFVHDLIATFLVSGGSL